MKQKHSAEYKKFSSMNVRESQLDKAVDTRKRIGVQIFKFIKICKLIFKVSHFRF